jgi:hypothetical protein
MGGCFSSEDPHSKYATGGAGADGEAAKRALAQREGEVAAALISGQLQYSTWVELQVSCRNLKSADTFS